MAHSIDVQILTTAGTDAVLFFFVTYVPFEMPGALLVKKIRELSS